MSLEMVHNAHYSFVFIYFYILDESLNTRRCNILETINYIKKYFKQKLEWFSF